MSVMPTVDYDTIYSGVLHLVTSTHEMIGKLPMSGRFLMPKENGRLFFDGFKDNIMTSTVKDLRLDMDMGELWVYTLNSTYKITDIRKVH